MLYILLKIEGSPNLARTIAHNTANLTQNPFVLSKNNAQQNVKRHFKVKPSKYQVYQF